MTKPLRNIAVDLTPVLPGGENGGAKIFVLELLRRLAELAPETRFVLLTRHSSHEELATLDRPNVQRLMVIGPPQPESAKARMRHRALGLLNRLPGGLRVRLNRLRYRVSATLRRRASGLRLRDMGIDLLFCPFTAPTYFEPGIPTVCTIYDLQYKTYPEFFAAEDVAHRDRSFMEACRRANALTAISDYSRDSAIAHGKIDPERIRTIHLRMARRISPQAGEGREALTRLGLSPRRYLVYPANFWKHKNHEMLLAAFGMACREGLAGDVKLVCTGAPGPRQEWLKRAAAGMGLGERVLFPGFMPDAELAALLIHSSGVVFPSLYEGFGLPVIEAMSLGVPVACSNATSLPEVAADAAILFDPRVPTQIAQAILSLSGDETLLRDRLIEAGRQRCAEFQDSGRMAREYWQLFQYAMGAERSDDSLAGVYADGWAGPEIDIRVAPSEAPQKLEIELTAPEWLPQARTLVRASLSGQPQGAPLEVSPGTSATCSLAVGPAGGRCTVSISPTFLPSWSGNDDSRELSLQLQRCRILRTGGECVELFPERGAA